MEYSVEEVAKRKHVHPETVLTWIRSGKLAAVNNSASENSKRRRYSVTEEQLAEFNRRRSTRATIPQFAPARAKATTRPVAGRDYVEHYKD